MEFYKEAIEVIKGGPKKIPRKQPFECFGNLVAFNNQEKAHFQGILDLVGRYIKQKSPKRPLCLGVFGPPGSGKSFSVEEIVAEAVAKANKSTKGEKKITMPLRTFNLTQISSPRELSELIGQSIVTDEKVVPVLFFDEFDAPLGGTPLGWLSWFLSPMHDCYFQLRGTTIPFHRAVFVFAGGTSSKFRDFGKRNDSEFKNAKGPDFVSRLRGLLDVYGPNERSARALRRAVIIWKSVKDRSDSLQGNDDNRPLKISKKLSDAFLHAGRFRYGVRSIGAVIEMCNVRQVKKVFRPLDVKDLPQLHLLESHVDRGPLDPRQIGGGIGLSAGTKEGTQQGYKIAWKKIANTLWVAGCNACVRRQCKCKEERFPQSPNERSYSSATRSIAPEKVPVVAISTMYRHI